MIDLIRFYIGVVFLYFCGVGTVLVMQTKDSIKSLVGSIIVMLLCGIGLLLLIVK